jgi:hypothetical protein
MRNRVHAVRLARRYRLVARDAIGLRQHSDYRDLRTMAKDMHEAAK